MPLPVGTRLGPYEIRAVAGIGGMGMVYRARDTRLDRDVAIKLLTDAIARDADAGPRFEREARLASRLSHPHICSVYDVGEHDGSSFIVMEFLEGEPLAQRLRRGPLAVEDALMIAIELADALHHAHRNGIVHRDLKPANVVLTKTGAKLLDFGIARPTLVPSAESPTIAAATQPGMLLGTPGYMAPEQLRGRGADQRSDIFAFGAVLYEMVAGQMAFAGRTAADAMAAVLNQPVAPLSVARPSVPAALDHVVATCLKQDPDERWQSIFDVATELRWITSAHRGATESNRATARPKLPVIGGALVIGAVAVATFNAMRPSPPAAIVRAALPLPAHPQLAAARSNIAISPDGRFIALVGAEGGVNKIFLRPVDGFSLAAVKGSEGATGPFFSPDGEWIGFHADGRLMKVARSGGTPIVICQASDVRGATWGALDTIIFSPRLDAGLYRVSADGGTPAAITTPAAELREKTHRFPDLLPDGRSVMFTIGTHDIGTFNEAVIAVQSLSGGAPKILINGGTAAKYLPSGHIVFSRGDSLLAAPFDLTRLEVVGPPVPVIEGVVHASDYGRVEYDVSDTGTLVYLPGGDSAQQAMLMSVDRGGNYTPLTAQSRLFLSIDYSPRDQSVVTLIGGANDSGWIYDLRRDLLTRLTFKGNVGSASWTFDGRRILFSQAGELGSLTADGSSSDEVLFRDDAQKGSPHLTPDGETLIFHTTQPRTGFDIWTMSIKTRQTAPWLATQFNERRPRLSPDGRFVAYVSNESGREEIYVRALANAARKIQVSRQGGRLPEWSDDGREIFFLQGSSMMASAVASSGASLDARLPERLFDLRKMPADDGAIYDVAPDGKRFVVVEPISSPSLTVAHIVAGWSGEVSRKSPQ